MYRKICSILNLNGLVQEATMNDEIQHLPLAQRNV